MKFIIFVVGIIATAIVVYNNLKQLWYGSNNVDDVIALGLIILGTIGYYVYNKGNLKW